MELQHQNVLRIVLIGQLALLDGSAETAGNVGVTGVSGVAVDVILNTALTDHHVPVAAGGTSPNGEILLALAQDLAHSRIRLAVGGEAAEADGVTALDELRNGVLKSVHFVHKIASNFLIFVFARLYKSNKDLAFSQELIYYTTIEGRKVKPLFGQKISVSC